MLEVFRSRLHMAMDQKNFRAVSKVTAPGKCEGTYWCHFLLCG